MYTSGWSAPQGTMLTVEHSPTQLQLLQMLWPSGSPPASALLGGPLQLQGRMKALSVTSQEEKKSCITLLKGKKSSDILIYFQKFSLMVSMKDPFSYEIPVMSGRMESLSSKRELASCLGTFGFKCGVFSQFQTVLRTTLL